MDKLLNDLHKKLRAQIALTDARDRLRNWAMKYLPKHEREAFIKRIDKLLHVSLNDLQNEIADIKNRIRRAQR